MSKDALLVFRSRFGLTASRSLPENFFAGLDFKSPANLACNVLLIQLNHISKQPRFVPEFLVLVRLIFLHKFRQHQ